MRVLEEKVAVIAGGTSGIGAGIAQLFAAEGCRLLIAGRRREQGEKLAAALGPDVEFVAADISVEADVATLVETASAWFGRLDCVVNSAGMGGSPGGVADIDLARWRRTMAVHVEGVAAAMKHAAPVMAAQASGSIINIASMGGTLAGWTSIDYSAAKAAVIQMTRSAAVELGQHGVRVNCISPGPILTGIFAKSAGIDPAVADERASVLEPIFRARLEQWQPLPRVGVPDGVAPAALWLASDASAFVTGQNLFVDGGISAGRPSLVAAADRAAMAAALFSRSG
jgi:NAD(P)-dependent dehydrogenase (short-subunit alcohol dehydrogenase family)